MVQEREVPQVLDLLAVVVQLRDVARDFCARHRLEGKEAQDFARAELDRLVRAGRRLTAENFLRLYHDALLAAFITRCYPAVLKLCRRLARLNEDPEDFAMQAIRRALAAIRNGVGPRGNTRGWLFQIARNLFKDQARKGGRDLRWFGQRVGPVEVADSRTEVKRPDEWPDGRDLLAALREEDPRAARMLEMSLGGDTYGQIAALFEIKPGAVEKCVNRARDRIRGALMLQMRSGGLSVKEIAVAFRTTEEKALECIGRAEKRRR